MRGVHNALAGVQGLGTRWRFSDAEVRGVVLEANGESADALGSGSDGKRVFDAEGGFKYRHEPNGPGDAMLVFDACDFGVDFDDLCCGLDLGDEDKIGRLRHDCFEVG
jgi:hypothetical protein